MCLQQKAIHIVYLKDRKQNSPQNHATMSPRQLRTSQKQDLSYTLKVIFSLCSSSFLSEYPSSPTQYLINKPYFYPPEDILCRWLVHKPICIWYIYYFFFKVIRHRISVIVHFMLLLTDIIIFITDLTIFHTIASRILSLIVSTTYLSSISAYIEYELSGVFYNKPTTFSSSVDYTK